MKNKKGFTLIELLAVIVILGLLLAIAIPSVTKYINESRKKTVISSINNYLNGLVSEINDGRYKFTDSNKIYAIPIECISTEREGKNPFGEWTSDDGNYFAYALVQYDKESYSYKYGFTFKDSSGHGLYPTTLDNLDEKGSQIKTGLQLKKLNYGSYNSFVSEENWTGFKVNDDTLLVKLKKIENNICEIATSVVIKSGTGNDVGDMICISSECFYVIESDDNTVTMLSELPIDLVGYKQSSTAEELSFSASSYWYKTTSIIKPEYGTGYPAYVYNEKSDIYNHVESYEETLKKLGVENLSAKLIEWEQLMDLGCVATGLPDHFNCSKSPKWLYNTAYWSGSAIGWNTVGRVTSDYTGYHHVNKTYLRPIVTISKDEINYD